MKKPFKIAIILSPLIILIAGLIYSGLILMNDDGQFDLVELKPKLQFGDLIFQTSKSDQSKAIQLATKSKYSHMGMIYMENDKMFVLEAVQPVKLTLLEDWITRGEKHHFVVKRLKDSKIILTDNIKKKMKLSAERFLGKDYDIYFEWSDDQIYCSELIWKIYNESVNVEIGKLEHLGDFDLSHKIVKQKLIERYGTNIPMDEKVISPASMFDSEKLISIYEE